MSGQFTARFQLMLLGILLVAGGSLFAQTTLNYGTLVNASISGVGQVDTYSLDVNGAPGEWVIVVMSDQTGGAFFCELTVLDPNGALIQTGIGNITSIIEFEVQQSGSYTIIAEENGNNLTGAYSLLAQRSKDPGNAPSLPFGIYHTATLAITGELHAYSFDITGGIGQSVIVRQSDLTGGAFFNDLRVFDPSGVEVAQRISGITAELVFQPAVTGSYTIWAMENGGDLTGDYGLIVQKSYQPGNASLLENGSVVTDTLGLPGEVHSYTFHFPGPTGEQVMLQMADLTNSPFFAQLYLFDPSGVELAVVINNVVAEFNAVLPDTGVYVVWAMENSGDLTGAYQLSLGLPVGIEASGDNLSGLPAEFALQQNYPNPFNPSTTIRYSLPLAVPVRVRIFNLLGQEVLTLMDEEQAAGYYQLNWHGHNTAGNAVSSGLYLLRLEAGDEVRTLRMMLVR